MRDKTMAMDYLKEKEEDHKIMTIAKERADMNGEERPKKAEEYLKMLKLEAQELDAILDESSDEDEKANAQSKKAHVNTVIEKLERMGVGKGAEVPVDAETVKDESKEEESEEEEESEDEESDEETDEDETSEDNGDPATFLLENDVLDSEPPKVIKEMAEVLVLQSLARAEGIEFEEVDKGEVSGEEYRAWTFTIPTRMLLKWITRVDRALISRGSLTLSNPAQIKLIRKSVERDVFTWLEIIDDEGSRMEYEE